MLCVTRRPVGELSSQRSRISRRGRRAVNSSIQVVLDPTTLAERQRAFADFFAHDEPDFEGWCERLRSRVGSLFLAAVRLIARQGDLLRYLRPAVGLIVEGLEVGQRELDAAPHLRVVQKFGVNLRNIDRAACVSKGIEILTLRRRANVSCAEHAIMLMVMLARKAREVDGLITVDRLAAAGLATGRSTAPILRTPTGHVSRVCARSTRRPLGSSGSARSDARSRRGQPRSECACITTNEPLWPLTMNGLLQAHYSPLEGLLASSDFIVVAVSGGPATRHLLDRDRLVRTKPGAFIVNVARADVVERAALIEMLACNRLGGFAPDPLYEEPACDDELLRFNNVILTPHTAAQPRFNALRDIEDLLAGLAQALERAPR
jgi:phosphoglycerate dehydrogenase-like enzyme